jgi:hypothetical protein
VCTAQLTAEDEVVLRALAAAVGVAVENARLFEQARMRQRKAQIRNCPVQVIHAWTFDPTAEYFTETSSRRVHQESLTMLHHEVDQGSRPRSWCMRELRVIPSLL